MICDSLLLQTEIETESECTDNLLCSNNNNNNNTNNNNNVPSIKKVSANVGSNESHDGMEMDCGGCGESVRERTVLCVGGRTWHSRCLKCCACARPLHDRSALLFSPGDAALLQAWLRLVSTIRVSRVEISGPWSFASSLAVTWTTPPIWDLFISSRLVFC